MTIDSVGAYATIVVQSIIENRCRFFIGAGIPRIEAKLPGFVDLTVDLVKEIINYYPGELEWCQQLWVENDSSISLVPDVKPEQLAEICFLKDNIRSHEFIQEKLTVSEVDGRCYRGLEALANLKEHRLDKIYTTNFDDTIRIFFQAARAVCITSAEKWYSNSERSLVKIIHLHGHIEDRNYIIGETELFRAGILHELYDVLERDIMDRCTLVFLGYGLQDPSINAFFSVIHRLTHNKIPNQYAVFPSRYLDEDERIARAKWNLYHDLWQERGITLIDVEPSDFVDTLVNKIRSYKKEIIKEEIVKRRTDLNEEEVELAIGNFSRTFHFPDFNASASIIDLLF
jgi:hypothetical protein